MTHKTLISSQGDPVGALVRSCLLEDRGGERAFSYAPPASSGGGYLVKWSFHNVRFPGQRADCLLQRSCTLCSGDSPGKR
jgi:hypothetical protein